MLNESKGNMYPFVTHTWNPIKGECPHACSYCYMKKWGTKLKPLRLEETEFRTNLGDHNFIFVGSSTDMWCDAVPHDWIARVLHYCNFHDWSNKYLFQTKNPETYNYEWDFPLESILACTIETNRYTNVSMAPSTYFRSVVMSRLKLRQSKMISIEPVMDFDIKPFISMIEDIHPQFVSIGANTNPKVKLPEPSPEKLRDFIEKLSSITHVVQKTNLRRLIE